MGREGGGGGGVQTCVKEREGRHNSSCEQRMLPQLKLVVSYLPEACSCPVNTDMEATSTAYQEREIDYYLFNKVANPENSGTVWR